MTASMRNEDRIAPGGIVTDLRHVLASIQQVFLSWGPLGLIPIAFFDAGVLPLPEALDILVIFYSTRNHEKMPLYVLAGSFGAVLGCTFLYFIAARGGHAFLERKIGKRTADRVRRQFEKYEFITLVAAAFLPPPMPMKAFVLAAGVLEVNLVKFIAALSVGRVLRYGLLGWLAVEYGGRVTVWIETQGPRFGLISFGVVTVIALAFWLYKRLSARSLDLETKNAD